MARFESSCVWEGIAPGFPYAAEAWLGDAPMDESLALEAPAMDPAVFETMARSPEEMGVRINASTESILYCGVCTSTW